MPHTPKTHDAMQKSVCVMCFKKPKNLLNLKAPSKLERFQNLVLTDYGKTESWNWLPNVICAGCDSELRVATAKPNHPIKHVDYESLISPQFPQQRNGATTRAQEIEEANVSESQCCCSVCCIGRLNGHAYKEYRLVSL